MPASSSRRPSHSAAHCLLSNGRYSVMLDANGSGFSRWNDIAVTRWREDATCDGWGTYFLLRDEDAGAVWSATPQPLGHHWPDDGSKFAPGTATFNRNHQGVESTLEIAVAADADIELRRLTLRNCGDRVRTISLTSYAELVLGPIGADNAHPAFSKMFVQTEWDAEHGLLLATRRKRANDEASLWIAQTLQVLGATDTAPDYETNRMVFLGRGRTLRNARALQPGVALSGSNGCVLDPVFSLRQRVTLAPNASVTMLLWTQLADSREAALTLTTQLGDANASARVFDGAAQHARAEQERLGIDAAQAKQFAQWLGALLVSDSTQRAAPAAIACARGGAPTLWAAGISGDRPIVLLQLSADAELARVQALLRAQTLWRSQRLAVDVVLLNTADAAAADALQAKLDPLISTQQVQLKTDDKLPKVELFALRDGAINDVLRDGLHGVARVVLGGAASAAPVTPAPTQTIAALHASTPARPADTAVGDAPEFANGLGGFVDHGRAYRIQLTGDRCTPQPWVNVIANPAFGFLVSAEGGGYAWSINSQQNPLTPWPNDPVSDTPHEVLYLRDLDDGALWSASALPIRVRDTKYVTTHGKGWSRFEHAAHGIDVELTQCVPTADSLKLARLRLCNRSARTRRLSLTGYVEWALGPNGSTPAPFVLSARDAKTGALFARNHWRADFGERVAFVDLGGAQQSMSGDRSEFLGALGAVDDPVALREDAPLSGRLGAGLDPCGALQTQIELPPHTQIQLRWLLGDADSEEAAQALIEKYRAIDFEQVLADVATQWDDLLDTLQVTTPDRALDLMLNDWLLYQVAGCRLWARTAYYQASGAYGYRDQLQDVMALCVSRPDLAREHLLRAAGRQFTEGDVQHWWLPPKGQGIRTKIRDDRIWLALVAMHYVQVTGDTAVLDEALSYLTGNAIAEGATDAFFQPGESAQTTSVYEHCALAIDSSLTRGTHGLPLVGTGDWNDGMNKVGEAGRGESSWMGWFLLHTIAQIAPYAEKRGDNERAQRWRDYAKDMQAALEQAWDGQWYRRGYYDDGAPLGSRSSDACQIDTIAQSWSVIAGAPNPQYAAQAMASVDHLLIDHEHRIARLFTPPFDQNNAENPGYIKGYPPGVRENGGQYTHGAVWSIFAWAALGDGDRAGDLFDMLNPIRHSADGAALSRYKVEPYVSCADVYSVGSLVGHGGWTWYTGSAAWLYRAGLEAMLGFHLRGDRLRIDPCIPQQWSGFRLRYLRRAAEQITRYDIAVENPHQVCRGVSAVQLDGAAQAVGADIALVDDGRNHALRIVLGQAVR